LLSFLDYREVMMMTAKNIVSMISILLVVSWFVGMAPSSQGKNGQLSSEVLSHAGKSYPSVEDPAYLSYDEALRACVAERIKKEFGVVLDFTKYSGFDLLEIEALIKFKKADERVEDFLKGFPKRR
jgi:hypothetical protein